MASVSISNVSKEIYSARGALTNRILDSISLDVNDGEFLVLVGPSGCGKTTLLRCIAGLEQVSSGDIIIDGRRVNQVDAKDRDIAMVFQSYALYPHMTVRENLAFGLRLRKLPEAEIEARIAQAAEMLEIEHLMTRLPREMSGGQRQRVAMGRALVRRPKVFLFDEPLSNLDATLRQQMRVELRQLHQRLRTTTIYVTHDQIEAMTLADRIAVLQQGRLEQVGSPNELYNNPRRSFVARFIGSPEMNMITGTVSAGTFRAEEPGCALTVTAPAQAEGPVTLGVRPEDLLLVAAPTPLQPGAAMAQVEIVEHLGWEYLIHLQLGRLRLVARCEPTQAPAVGATVQVLPKPHRWHLFGQGGERVEA